MKNDRLFVEEAITDLNHSLSSEGIFIRILQWERDVLPMISDYPQEAINQQLLAKSDILCALIGTNIGSPTGKYRSGTVEEISRFIDENREKLGGLNTQIYFKRELADPLGIDPSSLFEIKQFRQELGEKGVFFKDYSEKEQLQSFVRRAVLGAVKYWKSDTIPDVIVVEQKASAILQVEDDRSEEDDEAGLFDLVSMHQAKMDDSIGNLGVIGSSLDTMSSKMNHITNILETTGGVGIDAVALLAEASEAVETAAETIDKASSKTMDDFEEAVECLAKALDMKHAIYGVHKNADLELMETIKTAIENAKTSKEHIETLYNTITVFPNLSKRFQKACNKLKSALQGVMNFTDESIRRLEALRSN
jgi:hypothetical protein